MDLSKSSIGGRLETKFEKLSFEGKSGPIPAVLMTPSDTALKTALVLPGAGYSFRQPLLYFAIQVLLQKKFRVLAIDKIYADDPKWSCLTTETEARKVVEEDAIVLFPAIAAWLGGQPDTILGRSLGTFSLAIALERGLVHPRQIVWQTPALRDRWPIIRSCGVRGFGIIGTADTRYEEARAHLPQNTLVVEGADHGMEIADDPIHSIEILKQVTKAMSEWTAS